MLLPKRVAQAIIGLVSVVWVLNFVASAVVPDYKADPAVNGIFMGVVGGAMALARRDDAKPDTPGGGGGDGGDDPPPPPDPPSPPPRPTYDGPQFPNPWAAYGPGPYRPPPPPPPQYRPPPGYAPYPPRRVPPGYPRSRPPGGDDR